jgi:Fe-S oxidoreductase
VVCPVGIEHVPTIVQLRRSLVDEGTMGPTLQQALQNLATQGNSFGRSARTRARWARDLGFPVPDARQQPVRYLWFVGDYASFDERAQESSRALARILHAAGVDFGLLYEAERNAGNDVRRVGEEGLFEMLAEHNIEALRQAHFEEIFTTDPHTLNALRNEYPALGASYPVRHYTELLAPLLESGEIAVEPLGGRVTYHDPCYLAGTTMWSTPTGGSWRRSVANWSKCRATASTASAAGPAAAGSGWTTASSRSGPARSGSPRRSGWT